MLAITRGNSKLPTTCGIWSISRHMSCKQLCNGCYGEKSEKQYPSVMPFRENNWKEVQNPKFVPNMIETILKQKNMQFFRIHEVGDFFAYWYVMDWVEIARACPEITFFAWTKRMEIVRWVMRMVEAWPSNLIIRNSVVDVDNDGKEYYNFGSSDYISYLQQMGYKICPDTLEPRGSKNKHCLRDCKLCVQEETPVCFIQH